MNHPTSPVQGITEDDIAAYLANTPGFFERHAALLASIQLTSPHGQRAVSLQERQMEMLRERIKGLERRLIEMIRAGQDNEALVQRMHRWTCELARATDANLVSEALVEGLRKEFMVPQVALRVWNVKPEYAQRPWAHEVSADAQTFAASLGVPYCGSNVGFEAAHWLSSQPAPAQSLAMVPLRRDNTPHGCFGLVVLGSPDPLRYRADMGTEFLEQVGEVASAALSRALFGY